MVAVKDMAIWINGNEAEYGWSSRTRFDDFVMNKLRPKKEEASEIQEHIDRHHIKVIKGRKYWYQWIDGKWISRGSAEKTEDPRTPLKEKKAKLEAAIDLLEKNMKSCAIKKNGKHLVFDVRVFKQYVDKKIPSSCILVSDLLNGKS